MEPSILIDTKNNVFKIGDTELVRGIGYVQITYENGEWSAIAAIERPKEKKTGIRLDGDPQEIAKIFRK